MDFFATACLHAILQLSFAYPEANLDLSEAAMVVHGSMAELLQAAEESPEKRCGRCIIY